MGPEPLRQRQLTRGLVWRNGGDLQGLPSGFQDQEMTFTPTSSDDVSPNKILVPQTLKNEADLQTLMMENILVWTPENISTHGQERALSLWDSLGSLPQLVATCSLLLLSIRRLLLSCRHT